MTGRFEMSMMGELKFFLGFQIKQLEDETFLSQMKYTDDILKKFDMEKAKPIKTPMGTNGHLDLDMGEKSVDQKVYRSIIGFLLYLCASRPDIMISMCMCARFQAAPKKCHMRDVKRIMRYFVLTPNVGLWYPKGSHFDLIGYSNVDYAGCKVDRRVPLRLVNSSVGPQYLGPQRNKILLSSPWPKRSKSQPIVVVLNFYGCGKL
jgi:hypothetical protein